MPQGSFQYSNRTLSRPRPQPATAHPVSSQPSSHARAIREESALTFARLQRHAELQPETIAAHYLSTMNVALRLQKLIDFQKQSQEPNPETDRIIQAMTADIADAHREAFGIALDWSPVATPPNTP